MFYGADPDDPQPDWVDMNKVAIPQADEQQRLLANLITDMNRDRMPLPRFWYLPRGEKAAVIMTGDDHGANGTEGQFERFEDAGPAGLRRGGLGVHPGVVVRLPEHADHAGRRGRVAGQGLRDRAARQHRMRRLHAPRRCGRTGPTSWPEFRRSWPEPRVAAHQPQPLHRLERLGELGQGRARVRCAARHELLLLARQVGPGPARACSPARASRMRFADTDGTLIDVYQATTQLTDESGINYADHIQTLLDNALGAPGYYGVFTTNMHTDRAVHEGADAVVAEAKARSVPVVSAAQMLEWLDGRNDSSFQALSFDNGQLRFTVAPAAGARGLEAMVPTAGPAGALTGARARRLAGRDDDRGRSRASTTPSSRRAAGQYTATYAGGGGGGPVDATPPDTTIGDGSVTGGSATFAFSASEAGARFECRLDAGAFAPCTSPATFSGLAAGPHTFAVRAIDAAGNADPTPATRSFTVVSSGEGVTPARKVSILSRRIRVTRRGVRAASSQLLGGPDAVPPTAAAAPGRAHARRAHRLAARGPDRHGLAPAKAQHPTRLTRVRSMRVDVLATTRDSAGRPFTNKARIRLLAPRAR